MVELPTGTVTFVFTDVEGSTRLFEERPAEMQAVMARHDELVRDVVERCSGGVVKFTGDGVHAVFARAVDAIDATVSLQRAIADAEWPDGAVLRVRAGVHTGEVVLRDGDYFGPEVNRAARIMSVAHGGQIVCSGVTAALVGDRVELVDLGEHRLRDLSSRLRLFQVAGPGLESEFPPVRSVDTFASNLPVEVSAFIGRDRDVAALASVLGEARAVTVFGVGGVGKTRLALRVGAEVLPRFADGVWFCELAPIRNGDEVVDAVAAALGYSPPQGTRVGDGLSRFLEHKSLLLLLDNCEHLARAVAGFVTDTLSTAPGVTVLATSRESLGVPGERLFPLASLELPAGTDPAVVLGSESGALFALRAREARGGFVVESGNSAAVAELCTRLDGIPLAIELAAARTVAMSPAEIVERLDRQFRLLTGANRTALERHQTLRAAIDWSYDLLDDNERRLLDRCSVFVGGFGLAAAAAVAGLSGDEMDVLDGLAALVTKSLVERVEQAGGTRYRLLEMIRQYAAEHLETSGDSTDARDLHAHHYLAFATEGLARVHTPAAWDALDELDRDAANIAAAGRWLLDTGRAGELLDFFAGLPFTETAGYSGPLLDAVGRIAEATVTDPSVTPEGADYACLLAADRHMMGGDMQELRRFCRLATNRAGPPTGQQLMMESSAALFDGDVEEAIVLAGRAVELARQSTPAELSYGLALLSTCERLAESDSAARHAAEAVTVARTTGSPAILLNPLFVFANAVHVTDPEQAIAAAEECIELDRSQRKTWTDASQMIMAQAHLERGDTARGLHDMRDAIRHLVHDGDRLILSSMVAVLADAIASLAPLDAVQLVAIAESNAIAALDSIRKFDPTAVLLERYPDKLAEARQAAATMTYDNATSYVLDTLDRLIARSETPDRRA